MNTCELKTLDPKPRLTEILSSSDAAPGDRTQPRGTRDANDTLFRRAAGTHERGYARLNLIPARKEPTAQ